MLERLDSLDKQVSWWINHHPNDLSDWLLWTYSQSFLWLIVISFFYCAVVLCKDKKSWFWVLVGMSLCVLAADQISSHIIKEIVMRPRPCHELDDIRMFRTRPGGLYSFVSSHATNSFALATYLCLAYGSWKKKMGDRTVNGNWLKNIGNGHRGPLAPILLFSWAILTSYSRIYLGKHYMGDVVCGALLGIGIGATVYFVISKIRLRISAKSAA